MLSWMQVFKEDNIWGSGEIAREFSLQKQLIISVLVFHSHFFFFLAFYHYSFNSNSKSPLHPWTTFIPTLKEILNWTQTLRTKLSALLKLLITQSLTISLNFAATWFHLIPNLPPKFSCYDCPILNHLFDVWIPNCLPLFRAKYPYGKKKMPWMSSLRKFPMEDGTWWNVEISNDLFLETVSYFNFWIFFPPKGSWPSQ